MSRKLLHVQSLPSPQSENEPSSLRLNREVKRRLLEGKPLDDIEPPRQEAYEMNESDTHTETSKFIQKKNPLEILAEAIKQMDSNTQVEVFGPFGRIVFRAMHVSSNDHGVAFIVNKDHMTYEPNIDTNLRLKYEGNEYNVVYAGGYFTFRQMPFTFLSFIKIDQNDAIK
jgi:hypothetical protein